MFLQRNFYNLQCHVVKQDTYINNIIPKRNFIFIYTEMFMPIALNISQFSFRTTVYRLETAAPSVETDTLRPVLVNTLPQTLPEAD